MPNNDIVVFDSAVFQEDARAVAAADLPWQKYRDQRILVTGAAGMIPMYIVGALLAANDLHSLNLSVVGLVRSRAKAEARFGSALANPAFELVTGDVSDASTIPAGTFDTVFHGASPARPSLHNQSPVTTLKANVLGTINLLDAQVAGGGGSFVLLSSSEVYGAVQGAELIAEDATGALQHFAPRASYSEGKRVAETALAAYEAEFGIKPLALRFGHIYGPGMALDDGRVQADFLADVVHGRNIRMMSAGAATRTYTYVADAALGALTAHLRGDDSVYNVADPAGNVSIRELAEIFVASRPGISLEFVNPDDGRSFSPVPSLGLDASKLSALGWAPAVSLVEGVDRAVRSFEEDARA